MDVADPVRVKRPWFRRRLFFMMAVVAMSPVALFFLSNLWLALPWGREWIAGKITARTGLSARIDGATWSPWAGISLEGVAIDRPLSMKGCTAEPLLHVASIHAMPVWKACLQRRLEFQSVEVDSPRAVVPIGLLARPAPVQVPVVPAVPAAVAVTPVPAIIPRANGSSGGPPLVAPFTIAEPDPAPPQTAVSPVAVERIPDHLPPLPPGHTGATAWLNIRSGSFSLVTNGENHPLVELSGIHANIPVGGDAADSEAVIASITAFGETVTADVHLPLRWESPMFQLGPLDQELAGLPCRFAAKTALVPALPLQFEMDLSGKEKRSWCLPGGFQLEASGVRAVMRFSGLLSTPATWQGECLAESGLCSASEKNHAPYDFDHGRMLAILRGGVLTCGDLRLVGDNLSLLGNGTLLADGREAAVVRVVAEPSVAKTISDRLERAGRSMAFGQLGTPDRLASDLVLHRSPEGFSLELGQGGDTIDAAGSRELIKALGHPSP